jgi:hypothetical protein
MKALLRILATATILACGIGSAEAKRVPMYLTSSPQYNDYFYTIDPSQRNEALYTYGYQDNGVPFYVEDSPAAGGSVIYRLFKGWPQIDHFYTIDPNDFYTAQSYGWVYERNEGYLHAYQAFGTVPLYRLTRFDEATWDVAHYYTTNWYEMYYLSTYYGWTYERVEGYAYPHGGVLDNAKIPILAYHTGNIYSCENTDTKALANDLETMYQNGFTVVPIRWILEWAMGLRDGSTLPQKPVGITVDDGYSQDWDDYYNHPNCPGQSIPSLRTVLTNFKANHPDLPSYSPHATSFVVASRTARGTYYPPEVCSGMCWLRRDDWWAAAKAGGLIDIQNHSADHDNGAVGNETTPTMDQDLGFSLAVGGYVDGYWKGRDNFCRIGMEPSLNSALYDVSMAADYIGQRAGGRPDIFASPYGGQSSGLRYYLENYQWQHGQWAAFSTAGGWITRNPGQSRYDFKRFVRGPNVGANEPQNFSTTPTNASELLDVLNGNPTPKATSGSGQVCN